MLRRLGTTFVVLLVSLLLTIVQQCTGTIEYMQCRNNKGIVSIRNVTGDCKCSADPEDANGYRYATDIGSYKFHREATTWNEARKICEREGAHLAIADSDAERKELKRLFDQEYELSNIHFWLGIHDQFQEGWWTTVLDAPLRYMPWSESCYDTKQPDNGGGGGPQNCGSLARNCEWMDDVQCDWVLPYFCEKPNSCLSIAG